MRKKLIFLPFLFIMTMLVIVFMAFSKTKIVYAAENFLRLVRNDEVINEYSSFTTIMSAAQEGDVIKLTRNYSSGSYPTINKNVIVDFGDYTLTLSGSYIIIASDNVVFRASGSGGLSKSSGRAIYMGDDNGENFGSDIHLTIESGVYDVFNVYYSDGTAQDLSSANAATDLADNLTINGGTFMFGNNDIRNGFKNFISSGKLVSSTDSPKRTLIVKPSSYIESEDTKTSAKVSYTEGYSYYQKVTSLSSGDTGKKYIIGYSNLSEKAILLLTGEKYGNWSYIITDRHTSFPNNPTDTWRVENDSKFYGNVPNSYFYTLSYDEGKYRFANSAGDYLTHTTGTTLTLRTTAELAATPSWVSHFTFTPSSSYLSTGSSGSTSYITYYTNQRDSKYVFEMFGSANNSGLGTANNHVYAHLYEKVDVDPVVSDTSLRFGQTITKDMYDYLSGCGTTVTFGVVAKLTSALGGEELEYANAQIKKAITPVRVSAAGATEEDLEGDFYQFALVLSGITSSNFDTSVTARCYVCIDGTYYYYFNPSVYSLKTLANAYYNADDTSSYEEHLPVLKYLKDYGD